MAIDSIYSTLKNTLNELLEPNDFKISTWMAMGAALLVIGQSYFHFGWIEMLPFSYLMYRIAKMILDTLRLHNGSYTTLMHGRWTAKLPEPEIASSVNSGSDGLIMFVLGARINQSVSLAVSRLRIRGPTTIS